MTISDYELTDFSIFIDWSNRLSLPVNQFHSTFEETEFVETDSGGEEPVLGYESEDIEVLYNISESSVKITASTIKELPDSIELIKQWLSEWEMTDDPTYFRLRGTAITRYETDSDKNAVELLSGSIDAPEMIDELNVGDSAVNSWSYSNAHDQDVETTVNVSLEPYADNPEYFYIYLAKESSNRDEVWSTASNLKTTLTDLIARAIN